jgi:CubicO group peptidase (beta-lactamase class C family)
MFLERRNPSELGFDEGPLAKALRQVSADEIDAPIDLTKMMPDGKRHPSDRPLGPVKPRGKPSGVVVRNGFIASEYGDVTVPEVTFSATKSYISACAGIAVSDGLIPDLDGPVGATVNDGGFDSPHNREITWRHLLQQTSEWDGELFGIPDWIDRGRTLGGTNMGVVGGSADGKRELQPPGSYWEYNDVRVNRTALALLRLFKRPLPLVLKERIMDPIGASDTWQWHGYETSFVDVEGKQVQSVSGGAHWGGGLWISTLDHARFGHLYLNRGNWNGLQILGEDWVGASLSPCSLNRSYGFLWWLNHEGSISTVADESAFAARGAGGNVIFVDPARDIVIVLRWCNDTRSAIDKILQAVA